MSSTEIYTQSAKRWDISDNKRQNKFKQGSIESHINIENYPSCKIAT